MQWRVLTEGQLALLKDVLEKRASHRASEILDKAQDNSLSTAERLELRDMLSNEFMSSGIGDDSEPTARGLRLEELLDVVNRPLLKR